MRANPTLSERAPSQFALHVLSFERVCQGIAFLMGARCAFAGRNLPPGADGLAYLDVAGAYSRHDWHMAVNGYWGPLYAWLLAICMRLFHPGIGTELAMARALNFVVFTAALYTFSRYWNALAKWSKRLTDGGIPIPVSSPFIWILLGYLLFIANFVWSVDVINPDILVAAIVFAVTALLLDLVDQTQNGVASYACLGLLLAVGYYAKAILLYFAVFVLGGLMLRGLRSRHLREPITAILVFMIFASPFVIILSREMGHLTAGDSGKLNYAWFVNGPETKTWMKESNDGAPIPFYPGAIVAESPRVFHVPSIHGITYAPWYDAARFDKRAHPILNLRDQFRQLAINLHYVREQVLGAGAALTVPLLILIWYAPKEWLRHFAAAWFWTLPTLAVVGMYLLVHMVQRFVLGFSLVLWGTAFASAVVPAGLQLLPRRVLLSGIIVFAAYTVPGLLHYVTSRRTESVAHDIAIAQAISHYGIAPDDPVASIGNGQEAYWAHFAKVPVVAEVWSIDSARFRSEGPALQIAALRLMAAESGAKAAVWRADSDQVCLPSWIALPGNSGCMIWLR